MAGSVEHLAVAWNLSKRWSGENPEGICLQRQDMFLAGNLCPDGIGSREGYIRSMKMHTHFRDGIPDYEFSRPENLTVFHQRIHDFAMEHLREGAENYDLYLGYVTHILTDEIFMRTIRLEFMEQIQVLGLGQRDPETFEHFTYDVNQVDWRLGREYPGMAQAYRMLKTIQPYEIKGMVTEEELTNSRQWVLSFFFEQAPEPAAPVYYTYERVLRFLKEAEDFVVSQMKYYLPEKE